MPEMTHQDIYLQLINQKYKEKLYNIVDKNLLEMDYTLCEFNILQDNNLPYIFCTVDSEESFCAQMIGLIIDSDELEPEFKYQRPVYYLPAILMRNDFKEDLDGYLNKDIILQHELLHVHDILSYLKKDPDYPENYRKYGMNGDVSIEDLPQSIDMELSKLFFLEPRASELDYKNGETYIIINLDGKFNGKLGRYYCKDMKEYVGLYMKNHFFRIMETYQNKYPNDEAVEDIIHFELKKALNKYGKSVFGSNPIEGMKDLHERTNAAIMLTIGKPNEVI